MSALQLLVLVVAHVALGVAICWAAERADGRAAAPLPMFQRYAPRPRKRRTVRALTNLALIAVAVVWAARSLTH